MVSSQYVGLVPGYTSGMHVAPDNIVIAYYNYYISIFIYLYSCITFYYLMISSIEQLSDDRHLTQYFLYHAQGSKKLLELLGCRYPYPKSVDPLNQQWAIIERKQAQF